MPAKKKLPAKSAGPMSKSEFVRSFPLGTSAHLIVKEGKAQGYEFDKNFVWTKHNEVRRKLRGQKRSRGKAAAVEVAPTNAISPGESSQPLHTEQHFREFIRDLILDRGAAKADELFRSVLEQVRAEAQE